MEIPWKTIIDFIKWLIEHFGSSKDEAISKAASKFGVSQSEIRSHFND